MTDIQSKPLIWTKGVLFLGLVVLAGGVLLARDPSLVTLLLLAVLIWAAARFYYFLFYVLEHYVDPRLRYSGCLDMLFQVGRRSVRRPRTPD